jgi:exodeoxyribonuclease VII small subunit
MMGVGVPPASRYRPGMKSPDIAVPPAAALAGLSFEDALAELEKIVRGLEGGQQKLEDAISAYERGAALRALCEAKLAQAEQRVQAIVAAGDGALSVRPVE